MEKSERVTLEGSTFWKVLTTLMTRSATSDLSRKEPLASSQKWRLMSCDKPPEAAVGFWDGSTGLTPTLRYFSSAFLAAISLCFERERERCGKERNGGFSVQRGFTKT